MVYITPKTSSPKPDLLEKLLSEKKIARLFQERKHQDWNDTYELSRGKVRTNRLTQRQAVNIPLMKETEKTILSRIDEVPNVDWKEKSGDEFKELIFQSLWDGFFQEKNLEAVDMQDKKTCIRYGRPTKKIVPGKDFYPDVYALDIFDVVYDPLMDPLNIESARFVIHQNIFKTVREILADPKYTAEGKRALKEYADSKEGIVQSSLNKEELERKQERLEAMGVSSDEFPLFAAGDVLVNLTEHYTNVWNTKKEEFERRVIIYCEESIELYNETLEESIGITEYPFVTWSEDLETNDLWNDSIDDLIRVPNQLINVWFSQMAENRTLKNFQMSWYDATVQGYQPQTYEPGPGRMLPAPGDPNKTIMPVNISGLDDTLEAINFLTAVVERGTGATAIEKGVGEIKQQTLGEVNVLVGKALERSTSIAKFYRRSWYDFAVKWDKIMQANARGSKKLYKTSRNGKVYEKTVMRGDWISEAGYKPTVSSSSEQEQETVKGIQKFQFLLQMFPNNGALRKVAQKRSLEMVDLSPDELKEVEEAEDQMQQMMQQGVQQPMQSAQPQPTSEESQLMQSVQQKMSTLAV